MNAVFPHCISGRERLVALEDIVGESESEFAMGKIGRRNDGMIEPLEEETEGKKTLIEGAHHIGI